MMEVFSVRELAELIKKKAVGSNRFVIALSGFAGSGKTTLAPQLADVLGGATIIELDDFILSRLSERSADWEGFDWKRLRTQVLEPLRGGAETLEYDIYDWTRNDLGEKRKVTPHKYVILEGVGLLQGKLGPFFDYTIWIDAPLEETSRRGKARDKKEGMDHESLWNEIWSPNDKEYFEKHRPTERADCVMKAFD